MRDTIMYSFSNDSQGSKLVAGALGVKRMLHEGSTWIPSNKKVVINWGCGGDIPGVCYRAGRLINHPEAVMRIINKATFFDECRAEPKKAPRVPQFTNSPAEAKGWLQAGHIVLARTILEGARGDGIVVMKSALDFVPARLYTMYIDKDAEYRIHVVNGKMVFKQQKIWDEETPRKNPYVRNRENGFILITKVRPVEQDAIDQSIKAVKFFGLDFGAVDVVVLDDVAYVLEINSAPWMDAASAEAYADELKEMCA